MTNSLKMDTPDDRCRLDHMAQGRIGAPENRPDGPKKVSGTATYAAEYDLPDLAHGVLVRAATIGTLNGIDDSAVADLPGYLGLWTDPRFLRNPAQGQAGEAPVRGDKTVSYVGQPVAIVVAETFEAARDAALQLSPDVTAEARPVDPEADDAPLEAQDGEAVDQGDFDAAWSAAAATVDGIYHTPAHVSAAMEPHAAIAHWDGEDLTLYGAYQMLSYNRPELADSLGIPEERVRILAPFVGGGFGSKLGIGNEAVAAAIAARDLKRPVSVVLTRQQVFEAVMRRTETTQRLRLAADAEGKLLALGHESRISNLPDEPFAEPVPQSTHFLYGGAARKISLDVARIHRPPSGSVRAPGEAVGMPVLENAMDELAHRLEIDPVALRKINLPDRHPEKDIPYSSRKYAECMEEGARRFGWEDRNRTPGALREGEWLIGHGMAGASRVNMVDTSEAQVTLEADGSVTVETDMTDIGTGTYAILGQIVGEMLGAPAGQVDVRLGDSRYPPTSGSGGSMGASSSGSAVFLACEDIRRQLAGKLGCDEGELMLKDGVATFGNKQTPLSDLLSETLTGKGRFEPGDTDSDYLQSGYGAYFCEVAVNAYTGETRVRRMLGVYAAGRILNHKTARSQCIGGMIWGIGTALTEAVHHDPRSGKIVNRDLAEYHVPVHLDVPDLEVAFIEERDEAACPLQSKGIGELGFCGAAGAITNAIFNATGVRIRDYPITPDKLVAELPLP